MTAKVAYVLGLCALLVIVQVRAEVLQFAGGYRPLRHAPGRVPYSWDMFAVDLQRCAVTFDPPLAIEGKTVARWQDRGAPLEWDSVMATETYEKVAREACQYRTAPVTHVRLACPRTSGEVHEIAFDCP